MYVCVGGGGGGGVRATLCVPLRVMTSVATSVSVPRVAVTLGWDGPDTAK